MLFSNNNQAWTKTEAYATSKAWALDKSGNSGFKRVIIQVRDSFGSTIEEEASILLDDTRAGGGTLRAVQVQVEDKSGNMVSAIDRIKFFPDGEKKVYVRYKDGLNNWSPSYQDAIILDRTAPEGSISVNDGASYSNTRNVTLYLNFSDNFEMDKMQFSNDNSNFTALEAAAKTKSWTLTAGNGGKTVYVRYTDKAGNTSDSFADSITLDTSQGTQGAGTGEGTADKTGPSGTVVIDANAVYTNSLAVSLTVSGSDASGLDKMRFSNSNALWSAAEIYATSKDWKLAENGLFGMRSVVMEVRNKLGQTTFVEDSVFFESGVENEDIRTVSIEIEDAAGGTSTAMDTILFAADGERTVYARYSDTKGNYSVSILDSIILDRTPPEGVLDINQGDISTNNVNVTLYPRFSDNYEMDKMQFSNDDVSFSTLEAVANSKSWTLTSGHGTKTVYVRYSDKAGNISSSFKDTIILDLEPPTGKVVINNGDTYTDDREVQLYITCSDPSGVQSMQFSNDGSNYSAFEPYNLKKTWDVTSGDGDKTVYVRFRDNLGNVGNPTSDLITLDQTGPKVGYIVANDGDLRTNTRTVSLTLSSSDPSGVKMMRFRNDETGPYSKPVNYNQSQSWNLKDVEGERSVQVQFQDVAGNWSSDFSDEIILDKTGPATGTILINADAVYTNNVEVALTLAVQDPASTNKMMFSNSNFSWSLPETYATSKEWSLARAGTAGYKTVIMEVRDYFGGITSVDTAILFDDKDNGGALNKTVTVEIEDSTGHRRTNFDSIIFMPDGNYFVFARISDSLPNWSNSFTDSIILDRTPPEGTININNGDVSTGDLDVLLVMTAKDNWELDKMQFSNDAQNWSALESNTSTKRWVLTDGPDGERTVYVRFTDKAGNISEPFMDTIYLDRQPPEGTVEINDGDSFTNDENVVLTLYATDPSGVDAMQFSNDGITYTSFETYDTIKLWTLFSGEKKQSVYVRWRDNLGNEGGVCSASIIIDKTPPKQASIKINNGSPRTGDNTVTLTLAATDISGIVQMRFRNEDSGPYTVSEPFATSKAWHIVELEGPRKVAVQYQDGAGNWSDDFADTIVFDTRGPEVASIIIDNDAKYTNTLDVDLTLSAMDAGGVSFMTISNNNISWSIAEAYATSKEWRLDESGSGGMRTVWMQVRDKFGYKKTISTGIELITGGGGGVVTRVVFVEVEDGAGHKISGFDEIKMRMQDGRKTVYARFIDSLDNGSISFLDTIILDRTPPSGTLVINGGEPRTRYQNVTLGVSYKDNYEMDKMQFSNDEQNWSGMEPVDPIKKWTLASGTGEKTVYVRFTDKAGNMSSSFKNSIIIDLTGPAGSILINDDAQFTVSRAARLTIASTDPSGVEAMQFSNDGSTWSQFETYQTSKIWELTAGDGTKTVYVRFRDNLGNVGDASNDTIILDQTIPPSPPPADGSIVINYGLDITATKTVNLSLSCKDVSGIFQMRFRNDNTGPYSPPEPYKTIRVWNLNDLEGRRSVQVQFQDGVGNWSAAFSDDILLDKHAPTGSLVIDDDAVYTNSIDVTLTIDTNEPEYVEKMHFSNTGSAWSAPEGYAKSKTWSLGQAGESGVRTVYVEFRDKFNYTIFTSDSIYHNVSDSGGGLTRKFVTVEVEDSGGNTSRSSDSILMALQDGVKTVYGSFSDKFKHWTTPPFNDTIILDRTPPTGSLLINRGAEATDNPFQLAFNLYYTDNYETDKMQFSWDANSWTALEPVNQVKDVTDVLRFFNIEQVGTGTQEIYVRYMDKAGNLSAIFSDTILVEDSPPQGEILLENGAVSTWNWETMSVSLAANSLRGVKSWELSPTREFLASQTYSGNFQPGADKYSGVASISYRVPTGEPEENEKVYVWARFYDKVGQPSNPVYDFIRYGDADSEPPTGKMVPITGPNSKVQSKDSKYYADGLNVRFDLQITDATGVEGMAIKTDSGWPESPVPFKSPLDHTFKGNDGDKSLYARFYDVDYGDSQNPEQHMSEFSTMVTVDTTAPMPPSLSFEDDIVENNQGKGYFLGGTQVTVKAGAIDDADGIGGGEYQFQIANGVSSAWQSGNTYTFTNLSEAKYDFQVRARDDFGNEDDVFSTAMTLTLDNTPPDKGVATFTYGVGYTSGNNYFSSGDSIYIGITNLSGWDDGVGLEKYKLEYSTSPAFTTTITLRDWDAIRAPVVFSNLVDDAAFYFRWVAQDGLGNQVNGDAIAITHDTSAYPPVFAAGYDNNDEFIFFPYSMDLALSKEGSGINYVSYQISTSSASAVLFENNIVASGSFDTSHSFYTNRGDTGISYKRAAVNETQYFIRAKVTDNLGNVSEWSTLGGFEATKFMVDAMVINQRRALNGDLDINDLEGEKQTATYTVYLSFIFNQDYTPKPEDTAKISVTVTEKLANGSTGNSRTFNPLPSDYATVPVKFEMLVQPPFGIRTLTAEFQGDAKAEKPIVDEIVYYMIGRDEKEWASREREYYDGYIKGRTRQNIHGKKGRQGGTSLKIIRRKK
ncbi:hypothetical protein ACFL35_16575 [Candidatus Riflebacteria bacterium]